MRMCGVTERKGARRSQTLKGIIWEAPLLFGFPRQMRNGREELSFRRWHVAMSALVSGAGRRNSSLDPAAPLDIQWHLTLHTPRAELWTPILTVCSSFRIPQVHSSCSLLLPHPSVEPSLTPDSCFTATANPADSAFRIQPGSDCFSPFP